MSYALVLSAGNDLDFVLVSGECMFLNLQKKHLEGPTRLNQDMEGKEIATWKRLVSRPIL